MRLPPGTKPMKRTIIQLPDEVFLQLSTLAAKESQLAGRQVSISEIVRKAITEYLKEPRK